MTTDWPNFRTLSQDENGYRPWPVIVRMQTLGYRVYSYVVLPQSKAADRIEELMLLHKSHIDKLTAFNCQLQSECVELMDRIEELETALREIACWDLAAMADSQAKIARRALDRGEEAVASK